jgi:hypothetical protein
MRKRTTLGAFVLALSLAACSGLGGNTDGGPKPPAVPSPSANGAPKARSGLDLARLVTTAINKRGVAFTTFSVRDPHEAIRGTGTIRFKSGEGQSADLRYTLRRNGTARRYRLIIVGEALYLKPPAGTRLPHGKSWLRGTAGGSDAVSKAMLPLMSEVTQLDPTSDFGALKDVPALNVVGKERIGGTATTHYATHLDLPLLGDVFGPGAGRGARYELWIDDQGLPGKYRVSTKIPHLGVMRFAGIFTNWGTSITVKTPAPADVYTAH